ncbi:MAG TPA: MFS transporter [Verrucomicrobiota bacterium]|nr:MFS transporter [Verrucomicrobiales bacterium]HRI14362.1 MFS transporter [Verrucomicrobiota bacterium]
MNSPDSTAVSPRPTRLFVACIIALVAMSFGFVVRAFLLTEWRVTFNLSESQLGSIQGAGLFPQALTIILFSLIIDRVGYGRTIAFAFVAHLVSAIVTITATDFHGLYWGTFIFALAGGAIEAAVNPITATLYSHSKTHHLNILHAGWPGGLVIGGLLAIALGTAGGENSWRWKVALYLIPVAIYGAMMLGQKFPVQERVAAGVSYTDMLKEFGWAGCLIVSMFMAYAVDEILRVFGWRLPNAAMLVVALGPTVLFAWRIRSFGRPMFVFLLLVMILLATTEIGTDSWIADLMTPVLKELGSNAGNWVLIYTSAIMFALRFCAGPIVHRISPLGLLAVCALIASAGLFWLANAGAAPLIVFAAATCYGLGKTFFWPTTLGVVSEQFPKGGALTLSAVAGVGMISVGVLGNPLLGTLQDKSLDQRLASQYPVIHRKVAEAPQTKYGLSFQPLDKTKIAILPAAEISQVETIRITNNQATLGKVAVLPAVMFFCYCGLMVYFRARGGYRPVQMETAQTG